MIGISVCSNILNRKVYNAGALHDTLILKLTSHICVSCFCSAFSNLSHKPFQQTGDVAECLSLFSSTQRRGIRQGAKPGHDYVPRHTRMKCLKPNLTLLDKTSALLQQTQCKISEELADSLIKSSLCSYFVTDARRRNS